jgi:hypothetical protein
VPQASPKDTLRDKAQDNPLDDPPPVPPVRPGLDDCCHSGCSPCVFDLYDDALERYHVALAAWQARQPQAVAGARGRRR